MDKLVLIDGESLLEYTFQNLPERAVKQGNINGVYGFGGQFWGRLRKSRPIFALWFLMEKRTILL